MDVVDDLIVTVEGFDDVEDTLEEEDNLLLLLEAGEGRGRWRGKGEPGQSITLI